MIGAETVEAAVLDARANAVRNGVENAEFLCADAGAAAAELLRRGVRPGAVVLAPGRIVYVSCDAATQARDLRRFVDRGYHPERAVAMDMFPRTFHTETVVSLSLTMK